MSKITIKEDRHFLEAQRNPGRQGKMGGMDRAWVEKEIRTQQRRDDDGSRAARESQAFAERQATVELESSPSSSSPEEQDVIASPPPKQSRRAPSQKKIISPQVSAARDRTNISDRKAAPRAASIRGGAWSEHSKIVVEREHDQSAAKTSSPGKGCRAQKKSLPLMYRSHSTGMEN
ncbi:hypothetical protein GWK47_006495 [Chionoecetes opilio]|uniref:Uncharacterized protein n=1 Tax=Chionoecetes opilio TaxID=41210 RepID=A0A8J4YCL1_CHIOP|nr:hypothetical protein GWK47_006495 [Chionoecetes opilio]